MEQLHDEPPGLSTEIQPFKNVIILQMLKIVTDTAKDRHMTPL